MSLFGNSNLKRQQEAAAATTGIGFLKMFRIKYDFSIDGGAVSTLVPANNKFTLPKNAVIVGGTINATTAATSGGSATVAVGTDAGSSTTSILGATAVASLSANALINSAATLAAPVKLTAAGNVSLTIATAALTAGVIEVTLFYFVAAA